MSGAWVFVCGPSGAGKDSVIGWARERLAGHPGLVFAQRIVTRPSSAGPDHQAMEARQFDLLRERGGLAWHWHAHGWCYGIAVRYARQVAWGRVVVVNGSREHVAGVRQAGIRTVLIDADAPQLADRLAMRGRDTPDAIARRLQRNASLGAVPADLVIDNGGELSRAGQRLADFLAEQLPSLRQKAASPSPPDT